MMAEMAKMKEMMEKMAAENAKLAAGGGGGGADNGEVERLQAMLAQKEAEIQAALNAETNSGNSGGDEMLKRQQAEYARRGICLKHFAGEKAKLPHLINLDEDGFRNERMLFILEKPLQCSGPEEMSCQCHLPS